jgi:uncharacterized protein YjcR
VSYLSHSIGKPLVSPKTNPTRLFFKSWKFIEIAHRVNWVVMFVRKWKLRIGWGCFCRERFMKSRVSLI